jgi:ATP-binding cassette subfamily C protein
MVINESALWSLREMIQAAEREREPEGGGATPRMERGLALSHIDFAYDGHTVFEDLSLEVPCGSITAIVGASGAGKTTIVDLITGLVRSKGGHVLIDGTPIEELDLRRWRKMIGYVPQEILMFHDSVRTNVTLGDPTLTDADAEQALRDAGVWDVVSRMPGGLDASVGERGALLSGGQRQRVAIARALVHRPQLLVLDEATANLDREGEEAVWATVAGLRGKTTVVAISHQPALTDVADRIYRIEGGVAIRVEPGGAASAAAHEMA